jgi:hypothetical protein
MSRIRRVTKKNASLISKVLFAAVRRRLGRLPESWQIMAQAPRLHLGRAIFELLLDRSHLVPLRLRRLADVKTAMLIGCRA